MAQTPDPLGERLSEQLRATHQTTWDAAVEHRFVRELVDDTIDDTVYARYLTLDYGFINDLTGAVGHAVAVAPGMPEKTRFAQFLGVLTDEENDYFLRSFAAFGQPAPTFDNPLKHPVLDDFAALMARQRTAGTYLDILAVLVPVEWVYLSWASNAVARGDAMPERFYLSEWITLHALPEFRDFVEWMRAEFDREAAAADAASRQRAEAAFVDALMLEARFFEAAYEA
ncbi:MAG: TenA family protein [Rhodospirillaceae bacterium]|jgi:thiaminase/transcriptional activator TenA|nr:TenA family protein [Rhodospirillaceae bacterium]MBT3929644.1 TenA family protein [Rhodospirillaceae bacterium]MBT4770925.1 TenA family protein [Rhodospirillaceae bacterium]MBT5356917.1 TenA family protein [Rhodospirillaceae bacterium]MBT5767799.1 TenA family protein [Rhodospirillaceae bacterium]